jgi:hypothetical protein
MQDIVTVSSACIDAVEMFSRGSLLEGHTNPQDNVAILAVNFELLSGVRCVC